MGGELVIYRLRDGCEGEFWQLRAQIEREFKANFSGFVSAQTLQSASEKGVLIDYWVWENIDAAKAARQGFKALPSAVRFMETIGKVEWSGLVTAYPGTGTWE